MQRFAIVFHQDDERYLRTRNLHLAVILSSQGFTLAKIDNEDAANCEFVFRKTRELEQMVDRFERKLPIFVDASRFIYSWKSLREKIKHQNKHG